MSAASAFWLDRPTLVTGGTGLVGAWLVRRLLTLGADVVCLVRDWVPQSEFVRSRTIDRVKVVRADVRDQATLERTLGEYEVVTVMHLAAQTIVPIANRHPVATLETNIQGTWALLEACRRSPSVRQIVLASSDKAYGDHGSSTYDESTPLAGRHPYDVSKACADLIAQAYATTYNLPVTITRCGNFFGGGDLNWSRLFPGTIRSVLRGQRPVIRSDGRHVRDYFYVEDGAAAYTLLAERLAEEPQLRGQAFNFSYERPMATLDVVQHIMTALAASMEPDIRNEARSEIPFQSLSAGKARQLLGWEPLHGFEESLQHTVRWYQRFLEADK